MTSADRPSDPASKLAAALGQLARARRMYRQELATRHGISPLQLDVLTTLADGQPPEPTVGLLARELGVAQPTLTDAVLALERKGLVRREPLLAPRRTLVRLTPAGRPLTEDADPIADAAGTLASETRDAALEAALTLIASLVGDGVITVARTCFTCRFHERGPDGSHCALLDIPLRTADLRVNCPEHEPATATPATRSPTMRSARHSRTETARAGPGWYERLPKG